MSGSPRMSFKHTASTLEDAGRSRIHVSWNGDGIDVGGAVSRIRRVGGGDTELFKVLWCELARLVFRSSLPSLRLFRGNSD